MVIVRNKLERKLKRKGYLFVHNVLSSTMQGVKTNEEIIEEHKHNPEYKHYITDVHVENLALTASYAPKPIGSDYRAVYFKYRKGIKKRFGFSAIESLI
jgi:hypothetical protein